MKKKIEVFLIISICYIIFFPLLKNNILDNWTVVIISAANETNVESKGSEVWLDSIEIDGELLSNDALDLPQGWQHLNGRIFNDGSSGNESLILNYRNMGSGEIRFVSHEYSGIVQINVNDTVYSLDLYNKEQKILTFKVAG